MSVRFHLVAGGQFGSEAKGATAAYLSMQITGSVAGVRVGGPNAGHTVYGKCPTWCTEHEDDSAASPHPWRLRQVPVLAVSRMDAPLIIAQGSEVDIEVLRDEVEALDAAGYEVSRRILVDSSATVIDSAHKLQEEQAGMTGRIGSTAKGIGAARSARIMRTASQVRDHTYTGGEEEDISQWSIPRTWVDDTTRVIDGWMKSDEHSDVIVEGTQGFGLGLHGGYYPFATSGDCRGIDMLAQVGVSPWHASKPEVHVWLVVRPNPIRVAGNSGPLLEETTWDELGLEYELTTVTKKVRRVGGWDPDLVREAIRANGGVGPNLHLVLTMVDHLVPACKGKTTVEEMGGDTVNSVRLAVGNLEHTIDAPIELIGTGPRTMTWYRGSGPQAVRNTDPFAGLRRAAEQALRTFGGRFDHADLDLNRDTKVEGQLRSTDELTDWWLQVAQAEVKPMVDKALEYGGKGAAIDLIEIGRDLGRLAGHKDVSDLDATELGIYFYLRGKFGRWQAAVLEGRRVSDDTLLDIGVYVRMAQRARAVGGWPYAPEESG